MKFRALIVFAVLVLIVPQAHAVDFIFGGSVGDTSVDIEGAGNVSGDLSWKAFAGLRAFKYFGFEAGYQDLGSANISEFGMEMSTDVTGWDGYVVGVIPIKKFELFGKLGYMIWESNMTMDFGSGLVLSGSNDGGDIAWGAGGAFRATDMIAIRAEWEQFEFDETDQISMYSLGIDIRF